MQRTLFSSLEVFLENITRQCPATANFSLGIAKYKNYFMTTFKSPINLKSLPKLPVAPLQATLEKYLRSLKPLLTDEQFSRTQKVTEEFGAPGGIGAELHSKLVEKSKLTANWLHEWWFKVWFLESRENLIVESNTVLVCPAREFPCFEDELKFAARLIAGAVHYKKLIDERILPTDMRDGQPLDMSQYYDMFCTCRLSELPIDSWTSYAMDKPKHIVVVHKNNFFALNVYGEDGTTLSESELLWQLQRIVHKSRNESCPVGILTAQERNAWYNAFNRLLKYDETNRESIEAIRRSIFMVCLDKPVSTFDESLNQKTRAALQCMHGGGKEENTGNRWFDKTIQFIIGTDGVVGINFEHTAVDGLPIANMMDNVLEYIEQKENEVLVSSATVSDLKELKFNLPPETTEDVEKASQEIDEIVKDLEMLCFTFDGYGNEFVKSQNLSPDSFIQMGMQLAYYRLYNKLVHTYEAAQTRKFLLGRTETVASATSEALEFCKLMMNTTYENQKDIRSTHVKVTALRKAVNSHKELTLQAMEGMGVERLLMGMEQVVLDEGSKMPEFFLDHGYITISGHVIGSSQITSKFDTVMCYGSPKNGYGICYMPRQMSINFALSASNSFPETSCSKFQDALIKSLEEMHDLLLSK